MSDFAAMHMIEALRSGIPSRAVGAYFTEARPGMMRKMAHQPRSVVEKMSVTPKAVTAMYTAQPARRATGMERCSMKRTPYRVRNRPPTAHTPKTQQ